MNHKYTIQLSYEKKKILAGNYHVIEIIHTENYLTISFAITMHHSPLILPFAPVRMRRFSDIAVLKPLELSNYGSIINTRGR